MSASTRPKPYEVPPVACHFVLPGRFCPASGRPVRGSIRIFGRAPCASSWQLPHTLPRLAQSYLPPPSDIGLRWCTSVAGVSSSAWSNSARASRLIGELIGAASLRQRRSLYLGPAVALMRHQGSAASTGIPVHRRTGLEALELRLVALDLGLDDHPQAIGVGSRSLATASARHCRQFAR